MKKQFKLRSMLLALMVVIGANSYAQYCTANGGFCDEAINAFTFGSISTTSGCGSYVDNTAMSTSVTQGLSYPISITTSAYYGGDQAFVWIDYNMNNVFDDPSERTTLTYSGTGGVFNGTVNIPAGATPGTTRLRARMTYTTFYGPCGTADYGEVEDYTVVINAATACSGAPAAGTTTGPSGACTGVSFTLGLSGATTASGVTYQWQFSTDGVSYSNIGSGTSASVSVAQSMSTYYQCVLTCTASGLSSTSTPLFVPMNLLFSCYCVPTYASGCPFGDEITNVTLLTLNNSSTCSGGSYYTFYSSATVPNLAQGSANSISISFGPDGSQYAGVWIDFNQDGDFADVGEFCANNTVSAGSGGTTTLTINVPVGAALGQTMMRVRGGNDSQLGNTPCGASSSSYGETEDYKVNIFSLPPCAGSPTAGTTAGPAGACSASSFVLSLTGSSSGVSGLTYQWQSSPDGVTYTNIGGATSTTATVSETAGTYYQCIVTCTASGLSATSTALFVPLNAAYLCTCSSMATTTFDEEITNVTLTTLNNSSTCATVAPGPGSIAMRYANYTSGAGAPTIPSIPATVSPSFSVTVGSCGSFNYTSGLAIFIDLNQDGDFVDAGEKVYSNGATANINCVPATVVSGSFTIPGTATLGNTVMRIINAEGYAGDIITPCLATYGYGETEDYLISVAPAPPCPSPTGLNASSITTTSASLGWTCTSCTGTFALEYGPSGFTPGTGTIVNPATSPVAVTGLTPGTAYQFYVTQNCGGVGLSFPTGPVSFMTNALGDGVCSALPLSFGTNGPYNNSTMTTQAGEPAPPASGCSVQTGWCENGLSNTMWFSFAAPASGRVSIQSPGFDTQLALWDAPTDCASLLSGGAMLIAANDDDPTAAADGGVTFSSMITPVNCLTPGKTYYVQLDGYSGTVGTTNIVLTDLGVVDPSFTGLTSPVCSNATALTLTPATSGGVFAGTGVTGSTFDPAASGAGTYSVTYTVNGCYTSTQSVTVNAAPTASSVITTPVACNGGTATISVTATGGSGTYSGTGTFSGVAPGPYTYTVTDAGNACTSTTAGTVTQPSAITVTPSSTAIMCNGGSSSVTISATGGTGALTGTGTFPQSAGTTVYTVTDANSCTATSSVTVTEPTALAVSYTESGVMCNGGTSTITISATGGTPAYTGTGAQAPVTAGTYSYTVTDANGCMSTQSVTVTEPTVLATSASSTGIACFGGSATVTLNGTGGTAPYSGTGPFTQTAADGTVTYTLTDANGCTATVTNTETDPAEMFIASGATSVMCNGDISTVTISAIGGTPAYTGTGSFPQAAGTQTYTVTDANGCSVVTTVTVTEPPVLTSSFTSGSIMCNGDSATVVLTASGGTPGYSGDGTFMQLAGTTVYTVTDANGCTSTQSVTLTEPAAIATSQNADLCPGQSVTVGSSTYMTAGTYTDVLTAANSCDSTVTTIVTNTTVDISTSATGATITASSATGTFQWLDCNAGMSPIAGETNQSFTATVTGNYAVQVTDNGCVDTSACVMIVTTGINGSSAFNMLVYPNPTSGEFSLSFTNANFSELMIDIVDIQGKTVYTSSEKNISGTYSKLINLSELAKGLYYIKVNTGTDLKVQKLTIQ